MKLRDAEPEDAPALDALYRAAFPEEDLRPLVCALLTDPAAPVAIVAVDAADLVGHIAFSLCAV
ncbi:MAG: N-acetyltransferase, partial [Pseudomonadota bacterium]